MKKYIYVIILNIIVIYSVSPQYIDFQNGYLYMVVYGETNHLTDNSADVFIKFDQTEYKAEVVGESNGLLIFKGITPDSYDGYELYLENSDSHVMIYKSYETTEISTDFLTILETILVVSRVEYFIDFDVVAAEHSRICEIIGGFGDIIDFISDIFDDGQYYFFYDKYPLNDIYNHSGQKRIDLSMFSSRDQRRNKSFFEFCFTSYLGASFTNCKVDYIEIKSDVYGEDDYYEPAEYINVYKLVPPHLTDNFIPSLGVTIGYQRLINRHIAIGSGLAFAFPFFFYYMHYNVVEIFNFTLEFRFTAMFGEFYKNNIAFILESGLGTDLSLIIGAYIWGFVIKIGYVFDYLNSIFLSRQQYMNSTNKTAAGAYIVRQSMIIELGYKFRWGDGT